MYQKIKILLLFFLAVILQVSFLPKLFPQNIAPDLILVIIIIWSFKRNFNDIWPWIVVAGFILDLVSLERIGSYEIIFLAVAFLVDILANRFFVIQRGSTIFAIAILVIMGTIINIFGLNFIHILSNYFYGKGGVYFSKIFEINKLILKIVNNLIILVLIYWPMAKLKNIFPIKENKLTVR